LAIGLKVQFALSAPEMIEREHNASTGDPESLAVTEHSPVFGSALKAG
jgi:hypothetical protein